MNRNKPPGSYREMKSERLRTFFGKVKKGLGERLSEVKPEDIAKLGAKGFAGAIPFVGQFLKDVIDEFSEDEKGELIKELKKLSEGQFNKISEEIGVSVEYLEGIQKFSLYTFEELRADHDEIKELLLHLIELVSKTQVSKSGLYAKDSRPPTDPANIFGRRQELEKIDEFFKDSSALAITGFRGTGKSTLASMYMDRLEKRREFAGIYWRKVEESIDISDVVGSFFTVIGKPIDIGRYKKVEDQLGLLFEELNAAPYFLVLDNFEILLNPQTNKPMKQGFSDLIEKAIESAGRSRVLFTSWECPASDRGIRPKCYTIGGLDVPAAIQLLRRMALTEPDNELKKAVELSGGHPLALILLVQLVEGGIDTLSNILEDNTLWIGERGEVAENILDKVYKERLNEEERKLLQYTSLYREPVPSKAIVVAANDPGWTEAVVKKTVLSLIRKSLLQKTGKNYWLHPLVREFAYEDLENKREAHRCAGAYYCSLKEKTRENILEATHHMIKAYGSVTDEVVDYLKGTPENPDPFISHIVLDILKEKEITSLRIFELLNEFVSAPDPNVQNLFISEYGSFFDKIWAINPEKSIEVLRRILDHADSSQLRLFSRTVARVAGVSPDEAVKLWKEIIDRGEGDMIVLEYVFNHSTKDTKLGEKAEPVLKYLIGKREPRISLLAKRELERLEILKTQNYMTCEEHLEKLRNLPTDEKKLSYVTSEFILDDVTISWYLVLEILNNIYKGSPEEVAKLLKLLIKTYYDYNTVFQRTPRLIAKLAIEEDLKYLKNFLDEHENNVYIKYAGIRALDLIKAEIGEDNTNNLLKPLYEDTEPVIRVLANIMKAEMNSSYVTKHTKVELMNPLDSVKFLDADLAPTKKTYLYFVMKSWAFLKATEGTDPNIILNMLEPFEDMKPPKTFYKIFIDITQNHPTWTLKIATLLSKSKGSESRSHGLWFLCNAAHLAPEAAIKHLDKVMKRIKGNELTSQDVIFFMCCLTDIRGEELREKKEAFFKELSNHEDGNVRGFAKLLLNGV